MGAAVAFEAEAGAEVGEGEVVVVGVVGDDAGHEQKEQELEGEGGPVAPVEVKDRAEPEEDAGDGPDDGEREVFEFGGLVVDMSGLPPMDRRSTTRTIIRIQVRMGVCMWSTTE